MIDASARIPCVVRFYVSFWTDMRAADWKITLVILVQPAYFDSWALFSAGNPSLSYRCSIFYVIFFSLTGSSVQSRMLTSTALFDFFTRIVAPYPTKSLIPLKTVGQLPCIFTFMSQNGVLTIEVLYLRYGFSIFRVQNQFRMYGFR